MLPASRQTQGSGGRPPLGSAAGVQTPPQGLGCAGGTRGHLEGEGGERG